MYKDLAKRSPFESCLALAFGLVVVYYFVRQEWLLLVALAFMLLALLFDRFAKWVDIAWNFLIERVGKVMNVLLMSLVFYIFLTPIAIIYRLFSKDDLRLKKPDATNYTGRDVTFSPKHIENPW